MITKSSVESIFIRKSGYQEIYEPEEKMRSIIVDNFPELGRLTALLFLEWVQQNQGGAISLPTGKTPEYFIKWTNHYLDHWNQPDIQGELRDCGLDPNITPNMKSLFFVQMDEFYPIDSNQHNSFCNYVRKYYIEDFGLDPEKALVIDSNKINSKKEENPVTNWCREYEQKIADLGGIGFFLGGIGPDGHIAFNIRGSDHNSTTRLTETNYETQAAAAGDLGGIEVSGKLPVITIGLQTITRNPECTAIIMAAGEAKAGVISDAIHNSPNPKIPATALQKLPNALFLLTRGAVKQLPHRSNVDLMQTQTITSTDLESAIVNLSLRIKKPISELTRADFSADTTCAIIKEKQPQLNFDSIKVIVCQSLIDKIERGLESHSNLSFLHTEPHHDDIMLGYLPALVKDLHDPATSHTFATLTSGFTSVTNRCFRQRVCDCLDLLENQSGSPISSPDQAVHNFISSLAKINQKQLKQAESHYFYHCLTGVYNTADSHILQEKCRWILDYLSNAYPGQKDPSEVQLLKGMLREWEVETLWGAFGVNRSQVNHLRLGFYQGDLFTEEPTESRDIPPIIDLFKVSMPDILTVALDPEASGPDTHYKVLQAIAAAIRKSQKEGHALPQKIWGYRNIWYRFHPSEANQFIPVSIDQLTIMHQLFLQTFISQKEASFPSHEHYGPFSELAQKIQCDQFDQLQTCLGADWFQQHKNPRMRACRGMIFLREMEIEDFLAEARQLQNLQRIVNFIFPRRKHEFQH